MEQINNFIMNIKSITTEQIVDVFIAFCIYVFFRIFASGFSYITIRMFKFKSKHKKSIKQYPIYTPLKLMYIIFGLYLSVLFLKQPLNISDYMMNIINKIFRILAIIIFANGFANSLTIESSTVNRIRKRINPTVEDPMFKFILKAIKALIYIIAGFLVITELGYSLNGLVTGLGIGSVVLTLAAQDTAKNLFAGLVIFLDKPFKVGDWIEVENYEGTVEDITFRSTRVRTFENSLVNIPNSIIANSSIINWSKLEKRRYKVNLCLELDTTLEKVNIVQNRIKEMLVSHDDIIDGTIIVRFDNIVDNGINLLVSSYTNSIGYASFLEEKEKINFKIMKILREENVELAYDTKTICIKK